ncbi:aromatic ring-hydroxylating dioxygenase subunit alpha [Enterobacter cloacae complex sp. P29RS]|uniref:aromatic ring-hydroxylating oxygenase subunit alpha n=1 Tax=Enterobacter cloacae complex sp. P29RS TaxID=2779563 RepID=UPI0018678F28|nr:aromatic ring-hydroxylating dioxygenase subunit alpha [Enterobacter cloacae complex sp. P29RS]MBE3175376.1 aromatic ring-hydroxylating dioxygenase subunit alpha [Enterobacter cloacae complex sp. P29RS]
MSNVNQHIIPIHFVDRVLTPISEATGMPNEAYTNSDYFRFERDNVLGKTWTCIGFSSDLPEKGFVKPVDFMNLPLVIMKNRSGDIQVFHNVCSHRGMKLVHETGPVQGMIRCPYHSWTYDLDGNLKGTPHVGGIGVHKDERFKCEKHGLKPLRSAIWMGMVFINLSGDAEDFEQHIAPLELRWKGFMGEQGMDLLRQAKNGGNLEIEVNSNWKLAVENYCEAYHLPWVHPSLNSYSRLEDHYNIMFDERFAGQGSLAYNLSETAGTRLPKFPNWPQDKQRHAEYVALFPNVLLGIQIDHAFAMMIEPISAEKSIEHLRLFYVGDEATTQPFASCRQATVESWRVVFSEDIAAVEGMQQGRHSPGFGGGAFSPEMDVPTHFFQKWLATQVKQALEA